jgi:hypothetical protein
MEKKYKHFHQGSKPDIRKENVSLSCLEEGTLPRVWVIAYSWRRGWPKEMVVESL